MLIRSEMIDDIEAIRNVTIAAFRNQPLSNQNEHKIIEALRKNNMLRLSLVAEDAGDIVGHIAFSHVKIDNKTSSWFGLGPVSVVPTRANQGIGSALINQGLSQVKSFGAAGVVVLGEPEYYTRFGFRQSPLTLDGVPPQYFLSLSFSGETQRGEVNYHPSFFAE